MAHHVQHSLLVLATHTLALLVACTTLLPPTEQMSLRIGKAAPARGHPQPQPRRALLIIDVQNSFMPDGSVPIPQGDAVVQPINRLLQQHHGFFDQILYTQDWHPATHISFDTAHPGRSAGDEVQLQYTPDSHLCTPPTPLHPALRPLTINCSAAAGAPAAAHPVLQRLWPPHCVVDTPGADLHPDLLRVPEGEYVLKGTHPHIDAYSAFFDNGQLQQTPLNALMRAKGITQVYVAGVALDFCVLWSCRDARRLGYQVVLVRDAVLGVSPEGELRALEELERLGVTLATVDSVVRGGAGGAAALHGGHGDEL